MSLMEESNHGAPIVTGDLGPAGVRTIGTIIEYNTEGDRARVVLYDKNWWLEAEDVTVVDDRSVRVLWRAFRKNKKLARHRRKALGLGPYSEEGNQL